MSTLFRIFISKVPEKNIGTVFSEGFFSRRIQTKPSKDKINNYLITKYVDVVQSNESILEKRFPAAVKLYRVFSVGIKDFKSDVLLLYKIQKKIITSGFSCLTRKEMEVYYQLPKDMIRVAPVLLIAIGLPGGGVIFPVAAMFPKKLLTYHFWSLQQRSEFALQDFKRRLLYYRPLFRCLQSRLRSIKANPLHKSMSNVLGSIGSGVHPSTEAILMCKSLFEKEPFSLRHMTYNHLGSLLRIHDMHRGWRRRKRLEERAKLIYYMDLAIIREGGVEKMNHDEIKWACFFRGLNPVNMRNEDIAQWLNSWIRISRSIDKNSYSLLLHCPVLTAYNQPSNWSLLRDTRS